LNHLFQARKATKAADNRLFVDAVLWLVRAGAPWRDGDLASHRIDGHQRSFELFGFGQMVQEFRHRIKTIDQRPQPTVQGTP
jgi:hypothetical protein